MEADFKQYMGRAEERFATLMASKVLRFPLGNTNLPAKGVYLLTEGGRHLYVGRTDNFRSRLNTHHRESSPPASAAFAALLAREKCGMRREYGPKHARQIPENWVSEFSQAKARIRGMDIRVVAEDDPICQALLEICVAVNLKTPYNDFGNH